MSIPTNLFIVVALSGVVTGESESGILPVNEVKDCLRDRYAASNKRCWDEDCERAKKTDAILPCLLLGYDLIYQDSSYSVRGDFDVYRLSHCAIEQCTDGWMETDQGGHGNFLSGFAESIYSCLIAVQDCVKEQKKKDEL